MDVETRFNYFVGAISILIPLLSILWFTRNFRPRVLIKELEETLHETVGLYESYVADGVLVDESLRENLKGELSRLQLSVTVLRRETYKITTTAGDYREILRGGSRKILLVSTKVLDFRADLVRKSEKVLQDREERAADTPQCIQDASAVAQPEISTFTPNMPTSNLQHLPDLPTDSNDVDDVLSITSTFVEDNPIPSRMRPLWSSLMGWRHHRAPGKVTQGDVERDARDHAVL